MPLRSIAWFCMVMAFGPSLSALQKGSEHDELPPFQRSLMLVISGSHERFRPVMGHLINEQFRDFRFYEVKYKLDGAHICRIFEYRAVVYVCDWDERTTPGELSLQVESALGPDWQPKAGAHREILRFKHQKEPDNNPIIEVMELQNGVRVTMFPPRRVERVGGASWHSPE